MVYGLRLSRTNINKSHDIYEQNIRVSEAPCSVRKAIKIQNKEEINSNNKKRSVPLEKQRKKARQPVAETIKQHQNKLI